MLFGPSPVLVCGSDPLRSHVVAGLRAGGRLARAVTPAELLVLKPSRIRILILTDPPDAAALITAFADHCRSQRSRFGVPERRLIVMHAGREPLMLPALDPGPRCRIETFAIEDRAARALLNRWPLHLGFDPLFGQVPHLLVAGFDPPAEAFLVQALRLIQYGHTRPLVTLLGEHPERIDAYLQAFYPQAGQVAEISVAPLAGPQLAGRPPVTLVLVCLSDSFAHGLAVAETLARTIAEIQRVSPPILLEIGDQDATGEVAVWDGQILPISYLREVCRPGVLLDGIGDEVAQTIHEHYCDSIAAQGRDPASEPAGQPWARLATSYREANRHQADHLGAKLAVTDCKAVTEDMVESFAFVPLEVERVAFIEHQRWAADRYLDGWSYAPMRDNARKHHPQLIPYDDLSEPMKDLDRFAVRGVPTLLARSGLGVVRRLIVGIPEPGPDAPSGLRLRALTHRVLERLVTRYPDRALVVASTLRDAQVRQIVREALDEAGAGLFWLLPQPVGGLLADQPDDAARIGLLSLAAAAERRITLDGEDGLMRWFAERAEIRLMLGALEPQPAPARRVILSKGWRGVEWNFEY
jgi:hypothetical protein